MSIKQNVEKNGLQQLCPKLSIPVHKDQLQEIDQFNLMEFIIKVQFQYLYCVDQKLLVNLYKLHLFTWSYMICDYQQQEFCMKIITVSCEKIIVFRKSHHNWLQDGDKQQPTRIKFEKIEDKLIYQGSTIVLIG
ncbi:unnamed protein product [Paramecium octaurelia]|uniref:Uncharacterized protein n=1 Tax=Paramecium octaurelia TaxID=43137 RepID=A0A8S1WQU7_PAROT|nr:unnamed protein product [Paramecium octaurelia]